ncbi:MarR family winged helix-turn-helix transcriptional regulator [Plastorhodobacter daqingensis]|uniref:MarR family winged helix-turn-helix transcriptional regulator n=1 Tax=Plastorhodobacter daqingensis TaxID=1387281 RepID=A0ABW2US63_9RHOB
MSSTMKDDQEASRPADRLPNGSAAGAASPESVRLREQRRRTPGSNGPETRTDQQKGASISRRGPGYDQLNNRIFFRLFQLGNELQRQAVQQLGITTVQWSVLGALSQEKYASGIPLSQLGDYLVVSRQNLDGVLKRLERDGLVRRVTGDGDKRSRIVQLTEHGRATWSEVLQRIYQFYDQAASRFTFDERVALVHYLNELRKDLANVDLSRVETKDSSDRE